MAPEERLDGLRRELQAQPPAAPAAQAATEGFKGLAANRAEAADQARLVGQLAGDKVSGDLAVALAETEKLLKDAKSGSVALPVATSAPADPTSGEAGARKQRSEAAARELRARAFGYDRGGAGGAEGGEAAAADADFRTNAISMAQEMTVRQIGTRTFYRRGGAWVDSTLKADAKPTQIKAFSKEYFELLKKYDDLGPVLALDGRIIVVVGDEVYQIEPEEAEEAK
jgi:hypothetical protein